MKKLEFKALTARNKGDVDLLIEQREGWFDSNIELDVDQCEDWKLYDDAIYKLEEAEEKRDAIELERSERALTAKKNSITQKAETKLYKTDDDNRAYDAHRAYMQARIDEGVELYYVATSDRYYFFRKEDMRWFGPFKEVGIRKMFKVNSAIEWRAFNDAIESTNGIRTEVTMTFGDVKKYQLNMMRSDHWLKPIKGDGVVHPMFGILMNSLGGQIKESIENIEQWVNWKYNHPEDFMLPALVLYGTGGAGKNTFGHTLMGTIFGKHQAKLTNTRNAFGAFNDVLSGAVTVMVDEADKLYEYKAMIKSNISNTTVTINAKHEKAYDADMTCAWIIAGNNDPAGALLDGTSVDRRFSLLRSRLDIYQAVMATIDGDMTRDDAKAYYDANEWVFSDPDEVSKWLYSIFEKHAGESVRPVALRDINYTKAIEDNLSIHEMVFRAIFINRDFTHISRDTLYSFYKLVNELYNPSQKHRPLGTNQLRTKCEDWLIDNGLDTVTYSQKDMYISGTSGRTTAKMFFALNSMGNVDNNRVEYIEDVKEGFNTVQELAFDIEVVADENPIDTLFDVESDAERVA